jgi:hypothetical protein
LREGCELNGKNFENKFENFQLKNDSLKRSLGIGSGIGYLPIPKILKPDTDTDTRYFKIRYRIPDTRYQNRKKSPIPRYPIPIPDTDTNPCYNEITCIENARGRSIYECNFLLQLMPSFCEGKFHAQLQSHYTQSPLKVGLQTVSAAEINKLTSCADSAKQISFICSPEDVCLISF